MKGVVFCLILTGVIAHCFFKRDFTFSCGPSDNIQRGLPRLRSDREWISLMLRREGISVCDSVDFAGDLFYFSEIKEDLGVDFFEARTSAYYLDLCLALDSSLVCRVYVDEYRCEKIARRNFRCLKEIFDLGPTEMVQELFDVLHFGRWYFFRRRGSIVHFSVAQAYSNVDVAVIKSFGQRLKLLRQQ
jgi:hypothetical protein